MLNSEFNLYKREWLSLVFKGRNQQYGAFELRHNYPVVLNKAMAATFLTVAALCITETVISRNRPKEPEIKITHFETVSPDKVFDMPKHKDPPKTKEAQPKTEQPKQAPAAAPAVSTTELRVMKPVEDKNAEDVTVPDPKLAVGSENKKVENSSDFQNVTPGDTKGTGKGEVPADDNSTHDFGEGLQVMPEPVGGDKAWAKFLQKNLRFPAQAQDAGVSGRVYLSFIIEKDGHLSNITIERKAGYGFDEEASRVLKLAPAWKPGMQNGQAVRVRYLIPINFQLAEQ